MLISGYKIINYQKKKNVYASIQYRYGKAVNFDKFTEFWTQGNRIYLKGFPSRKWKNYKRGDSIVPHLWEIKKDSGTTKEENSATDLYPDMNILNFV